MPSVSEVMITECVPGSVVLTLAVVTMTVLLSVPTVPTAVVVSVTDWVLDEVAAVGK